MDILNTLADLFYTLTMFYIVVAFIDLFFERHRDKYFIAIFIFLHIMAYFKGWSIYAN